jgi:hypothetical protein
MHTDIFAACVSTKISHHNVHIIFKASQLTCLILHSAHIMQTPHYAIQVPNADWFLVKICGTKKSTDMYTGSVIEDKQGDIIQSY